MKNGDIDGIAQNFATAAGALAGVALEWFAKAYFAVWGAEAAGLFNFIREML